VGNAPVPWTSVKEVRQGHLILPYRDIEQRLIVSKLRVLPGLREPPKDAVPGVAPKEFI